MQLFLFAFFHLNLLAMKLVTELFTACSWTRFSFDREAAIYLLQMDFKAFFAPSWGHIGKFNWKSSFSLGFR